MGASVDVSGFLLTSGGLLTTTNSRSPTHLLNPQVLPETGLASSLYLYFNSFRQIVNRANCLNKKRDET
jgi:hypothetical protein